MFYKCNICGNFVGLVEDGGGELVCCGEPMEKLEEKSSEEGNEKHLPVVEVEGNKVKVTVGSIQHPMLDEHYIKFIVLKYNDKTYKKELKPNKTPILEFEINEFFEKMDVYEYCNVHGLWKTEFKR